MIDPALQQKLSEILSAANIKPEDVGDRSFVVSQEVIDAVLKQIDAQLPVIELSAGIGSVTSALAARGNTIYAFEPNESLAKVLEQQEAGQATVHVARQGNDKELRGQIREIALRLAPPVSAEAIKPVKAVPRYAVVASAPFEDAYQMLQPVLDQHFRPEIIVFVVPQSHAKSLEPHARDFTALSYLVDYFGKPEIIRLLAADDFLPPTREPSSLIVVRTLHMSRFTVGNRPLLFKMIEAGLKRQRTLPDSMSLLLHIPSSDIRMILRNCSMNPSRRANTLRLDDWRKFYQEYEVYRTTEGYIDQFETKPYDPWLEDEKKPTKAR